MRDEWGVFGVLWITDETGLTSGCFMCCCFFITSKKEGVEKGSRWIIKRRATPAKCASKTLYPWQGEVFASLRCVSSWQEPESPERMPSVNGFSAVDVNIHRKGNTHARKHVHAHMHAHTHIHIHTHRAHRWRNYFILFSTGLHLSSTLRAQ